MKREPSACSAAKPPRKQCKHCPWKVSTDPHTIPNGYSVERHRGIAETISEGTGNLHAGAHGGLKIMACHETHDLPCIGWIQNQVDNNNLGVRLAIIHGRLPGDYVLDGPQHERFEDTLPKAKGRRRRARG